MALEKLRLLARVMLACVKYWRKEPRQEWFTPGELTNHFYRIET
jgi:hypothetical protein